MSYRPIDYEWMKLTPVQPPVPRLWQLPPWTGILGNAALLNMPPPRAIQPPRIQPQIQLALPDWGERHPRRGGTQTDVAPPPQPQLDIKTWLETQQIKNMPPGLRELYSAWLGAGRYAVVTPALDVLSRWIRREDPTRGLEEFQRRAEAASYASPWAHLAGQGVGLLGLGGLTAEGLIARGAGATNIERLLSGLRSSLKPAAVGGAAGAAAGAAVGAAAGRDPFAEAAKYGTVGFMTGLGGVPKERLIAAGLLGATVGGSTAKGYGLEKGLEAGSAVFLLPVVAPVERGIGGVVLGTTRRPAAAAGLKTEVSDPRYAQIIRNIATQLRSRMEVKPEPGLTPEDAAAVAAQLRRNPAEQRMFFQSLMEDAVAKMRGGGDAETVLTQLKLIRQKLDPVSRMRFDEVLRQHGLAEAKYATPEYSLREEDATKLAHLFRREPQYALTDEAAKLLNQFLKPSQKPQYTLTDEAAQRLNLFLRRTPEYQLTDESAKLLNSLFKQRQEPQYALTDEAAQRLNLFLRRTPEYALTDEAAARLDQFLRVEPRRIQLQTLSEPGARRIQLINMRSEPEPRSYMLLKTRSEQQYALTDVLLNQLFRQEPRYALAYRLEPLVAARQDQRQTYAAAPAVAQVVAQRTAQQTAAAQTDATTTTTDATATTPGVTPTTTPPPETPSRTPPPETPPGAPPYIPPWMLNLPAYIALPLLAQMGLRLPPPPNPNLPLGTYLRMLRFPALGRQREVYVLI